MTNALLGGTSPPVAAAPPRLPIETHYDLLAVVFFFRGRDATRAALSAAFISGNAHLVVFGEIWGKEFGFVVEFSSLNRTSVAACIEC